MFEAIKSFLQQTNMIREARINVPRRLFHTDLFSKITIEECILDIKLAKRLVIGHSKKKDNTNSGSIDDRAKSVSVVKIKYLCIAFGNKAGFKALDRSIGQILGSKHPFGTHNIGVGKSRDQNPGTISLQSLNFFIHAVSQAGFLAADLNPFGSMDAKRAERRPKDPKAARFAGWRVLKIPALARVSI